MLTNFVSTSSLFQVAISSSITYIYCYFNASDPLSLSAGFISGNMIGFGIRSIRNGRKLYGISQIMCASSLLISNIALNYLNNISNTNNLGVKRTYSFINSDGEQLIFPWGTITLKSLEDHIKSISCIASKNEDFCDVYLSNDGMSIISSLKKEIAFDELSFRIITDKLFENCGSIISTLSKTIRSLKICLK
ncbi:MAG: hypothetical protein K1060chlam5_01060 [Candidatus Anoxychlamydiales bacterium]|nr:hypothetical protein [Candidatus Anoxychlamydiales bacterium]